MVVFVMRFWSVVLVWFLALYTANGGRAIQGGEADPRREADLVTNLPGQPAVAFKHYSGYVELDPQTKEKALFYWFFEAQSDVSNKPLVLWLNGGPGCSSVAIGAAQELGPFLVKNDGLILNDFSWNIAANMIFLESPVGVGFSYSNKTSDLEQLGDGHTAEDSLAFLLGWFQRFPDFKSNDFYVAGESYAGHYAPQLADLIYENNKEADKDSHINLKGFMVVSQYHKSVNPTFIARRTELLDCIDFTCQIGNAVVDEETDTNGMVDYAWSHAIISDELHASLLKECTLVSDNQTQHCSDNLKGFLEAYSLIDIYSIYSPACVYSSQQTSPKLFFPPRFLTKHNLWQNLPSAYDPCSVGKVEKYFNREDVQMALHANVTKLSYPYTLCSGVISLWADAADTVLPTIQKLLNAGLRIWIYSGDTDGRVPVTSSRYSIKKMGLKVKEEWRAWFSKKQVGGWVETFEGGLSFVTVRGAGHQVPIFAPEESLSIFSHFLSALPLPSSTF